MEAAVKAIPAVIMNGLTVCGNLLPAVGMAMLLKLLWNNKICVYFFLGFVLVAYLKLPLIALAALGVIAALLVAQRDLELNQLLRVKAAAAPAAVPAQGILDEEEEDFSMSKITDVSYEKKRKCSGPYSCVPLPYTHP